MARMPQIWGASGLGREAAHGQDPAARGDFFEEGPGGGYFSPGGPSVRRGRAGMRRHDVPAERFECQLAERPLEDGRGRLGRPLARQLPLGRERDAGNAGAAVAGGLADEKQLRGRPLVEVVAEAPPADLGPVAVAIEVERLADLGGGEPPDEPFRVHGVTMLMRVRGRVAALAAVCAGVCVGSAHAAPPQGFQSDSAFAGSYAARAVTGVPATTQRVSCYTPEVLYAGSLSPSQGYPDGGSTPCAGAATTGELIGPFGTQNVANSPLRVKDFSESDLHVDPTNPQHLIAVSKWFVNVEGYNHLTGFFESYDGGLSWPQQGHVPGYEGWTDNSDPVGAFDPWGNFYAVLLPYMFRYLVTGEHFFLAPDVNPRLPGSGMAVAVRPRGVERAAQRRAGSHPAHAVQRRAGLRQAVGRDRPQSAQPALRPGLRFLGD